MQNLILTILLLFITNISVFSQQKTPSQVLYTKMHKPISIEGVVDYQYVTNDVSQHIKNILFLQEQADLILPNRAYLINLNEESQQETQQTSIIVLTSNNTSDVAAQWNVGDTISVQVLPMLGDSTIYYTNTRELMNTKTRNRDNRLSQFWKKPAPNDTLYSSLTNESDLRYIRLLIEQLDNDMEVIIETETNTSTPVASKSPIAYDRSRLSDYVKQKLQHLKKFPYKAPTPDANKLQWQQWHKWLPEVKILETNDKFVFWENACSKDTISRVNGERFLQADNDSLSIYYFSNDSTFIIDTKNNNIDKTAGIDSSLYDRKWKSAKLNVDENAEFWISENAVLFDDSGYLKLEDENTLIVTIENTLFQQFVKVYRMDADGQIGKAKILMSGIPLGDNSESNFGIEKILEANGNYYVVISTNNKQYWNVFDEDLFKVQRRGFIQDKERDKDMHKQDKKPKHRHRF